MNDIKLDKNAIELLKKNAGKLKLSDDDLAKVTGGGSGADDESDLAQSFIPALIGQAIESSLRCPECGGGVRFVTGAASGLDDESIRVECKKCNYKKEYTNEEFTIYLISQYLAHNGS